MCQHTKWAPVFIKTKGNTPLGLRPTCERPAVCRGCSRTWCSLPSGRSVGGVMCCAHSFRGISDLVILSALFSRLIWCQMFWSWLSDLPAQSSSVTAPVQSSSLQSLPGPQAKTQESLFFWVEGFFFSWRANFPITALLEMHWKNTAAAFVFHRPWTDHYRFCAQPLPCSFWHMKKNTTLSLGQPVWVQMLLSANRNSRRWIRFLRDGAEGDVGEKQEVTVKWEDFQQYESKAKVKIITCSEYLQASKGTKTNLCHWKMLTIKSPYYKPSTAMLHTNFSLSPDRKLWFKKKSMHDKAVCWH